MLDYLLWRTLWTDAWRIKSDVEVMLDYLLWRPRRTDARRIKCYVELVLDFLWRQLGAGAW
jgi:hypothetical protein